MIIKEISDLNEMLNHFEVIQQLYPNMSIQTYETYLQEMIPNNYTQIAVFENNKCIAISGCWIGTKLWCGRYLELDNVIVHPNHQQKGVGKLISKYLDEKAEKLNCNIMALDAYTTNFKAHRFYYNQGFGPKGFHFVKILNKEGIN
jgi:GNAT superfamily N-acetyltransferase